MLGSLVFSLIGGAISSRFFIGASASAQKISQWEKVIAAEDFLLLDKNGNPHARLGLLEKDQPGLYLKDFNDKVRAVLVLSEAGSPSLSLLDKDGTPRARLSLSDEGEPGLSLLDQNGKVIWSTERARK